MFTVADHWFIKVGDVKNKSEDTPQIPVSAPYEVNRGSVQDFNSQGISLFLDNIRGAPLHKAPTQKTNRE